MNVFEFAMQKEKDAETFYRGLAEKTDHPGLKRIFTWLAGEEVRHYEVVKEMQDATPATPTSNILKDTVKLFQDMRRDKEYIVDEADRQVEVYNQAREIENESIEFYSQKADEAEDTKEAEIFRQLANQERMHYRLIDNLLDFVLQPETYVENGEFSHILDKERGTDYYPETP